MHRLPDGTLIYSATDLVGFLECGHLTNLDRAVTDGHLERPHEKDATLDLIRDRGGRHEIRYIEQLELAGRTITRLDSDRRRPYAEREAETVVAMRRGADVIYQATVFDGRWVGHPDFLLRVDGASALGDWHYEVADTKLAHSAKASALIQICSYVEQIERIQQRMPEHVYVVTGGLPITEHRFRTAEMMAYYRHAKARFERELERTPPPWPMPRAASYPEPVEHCAVCRWKRRCDGEWHANDDLPIVAGITRSQRATLSAAGITTRGALASATVDPKLQRVADQARVQVASDKKKPPIYELLEPERDADGEVVADRGLAALPAAAQGDLYFDIEGDPFAFWEGLEYLFGIWDGAEYRAFWAKDRAQEKQAFEDTIDHFIEHLARNPEMHIYHYGVYEPSHMKRLAGRHATRENELDDLLRKRVFVDLYRVVRQGLRAGVESYSIKRLEDMYGYTREIDLRDAGDSIVEFELWLDGWLEDGIDDEKLLADIEAYNRDDCVSTHRLRDWLEFELRPQAARQFGAELPRPSDKAAAPAKPPTVRDVRLAELISKLAASIRSVPEPDPGSDAAATVATTRLVADMLDFHRREDKASWWRFFELLTLSDDDLFSEQEAIGRLSPPTEIEVKDNGKKVFRYTFPVQEHKVGNRSDLYDPRLPPFEEGGLGRGVINKDQLTLDITRPAGWDGTHPTSIVPHDRIPLEGLQDALIGFGEWLCDNPIDSDAEGYRAVRDLLLRRRPRIVGEHEENAHAPLVRGGEMGSDGAIRLARQLDGTTLAIQGPPGSGKTYSGARMILELVRDPERTQPIGVTGSNHKVITNLLREVWEAAHKEGMPLRVLEKIDGNDVDPRAWDVAKDNGKLDRMLADKENDFQVIAGTVWLWARKQLAGSVGTLFVDEAGQVALASVVAAGGAARNIVLLGDPQQLDQVLQGAHPLGAEKSALGHFLGDEETVADWRGIFLENTWRMHPAITEFTSQLFYEGRLKSINGLEQQTVLGEGDWTGSGLRWLPIEHDGNTNASVDEARAVVDIVRELLGREWRDKDGKRELIGPGDIRIVSPFNAHRLLIDSMLAEAGVIGVQVGTVDKFQGQQAPVSIYTLATSRPEDAPRGMKFLYSLNRLNVATSRAKALAIVVCSPRLLSVVPRTPEQLRMANGLATFVEFARPTAQQTVDDA